MWGAPYSNTSTNVRVAQVSADGGQKLMSDNYTFFHLSRPIPIDIPVVNCFYPRAADKVDIGGEEYFYAKKYAVE